MPQPIWYRHAEVIAQHPQQRRIRFGVDVNHLIVDGNFYHCVSVDEHPEVSMVPVSKYF